MSESEIGLLHDARRGDERAFAALYQRHRTPLFRFAWRLTGSIPIAEDIIQECFLALLRGAAFQGGSLRAYLFGIARHLAGKRLRLGDRESAEVDETDAAAGPLEALLSIERSEAVSRAVTALPPLQREAIVLFEYEDLALEDIAQVTGVEIGAVKARLHRARETLRRRLLPLMTTQGRCS